MYGEVHKTLKALVQIFAEIDKTVGGIEFAITIERSGS